MTDWPKEYTVHLGEGFPVTIPLLDIGGGFHIYSFDMTGQTAWNMAAARELNRKLSGYDFDGFVTVQTKSCGLTQALTALRGDESYLELRKSRKPFMIDPLGIAVESITTHGRQELWIGREKYRHFIGKRLCLLDDVVSTGGTISAVLKLAEKVGFSVAVVACVLTEGEKRTQYQGLPLISLDNIPLPGKL